uniref:Uncharacterized protein LOC111106302 isoform X2 n=1 Tax=Crassostrea virginica TaxID=6565 RepID=A0A8B8B1Z6_CRAVI|nr:uncharacterized protein LOC111106302 isoform X2 [Crassostrea virginica]
MFNIRSKTSEPQSTQTVEITTSKIISESYSTQNEEITSKMISKCSGDKVEDIVAAVVSGTVFGVLITIGVWILKGKLSKENLWRVRFIAQRHTNKESPKTSLSDPAVSIENHYLEITHNNFESSHYTSLKKSYSPKEESAVYDHPD